MFKKITSVQVTDSIAEITRYQDREILERSLVTALGDILHNPELCLYKVILNEHGADEEEVDIDLLMLIHYKEGIILSHEETRYQANEIITEGIREAVFSGEVSAIEDDRDEYALFIYPVFDQDGEVVSILTQRSKRNRFQDQQLAYGFLRVYSNYLSLLEDSQTDKLTGLLNRETLDKEVLRHIPISFSRSTDEDDISVVRRQGDEMQSWLVLVDLDFFKKVNDNFGHLIGDEILILFGRLMTSTFRHEDKLFRYGGEEFVVLLKTRTKKDLHMVLNRFNQILRTYEFPQIGNITATLGAVVLESGLAVSSALGHADSALYYGKTNGRDQVVLYGDLIEKGLIKEHKHEVEDQVSFF